MASDGLEWRSASILVNFHMRLKYSTDIRQKILSACQNKEGTQRELAARFKVSLSFISEFFRQYRETGKIEPKPKGGDRRSLI
ncbi:MAG: hypothetical protein ACK4V0_17190, partial [Aphanizomenon sp.]